MRSAWDAGILTCVAEVAREIAWKERTTSVNPTGNSFLTQGRESATSRSKLGSFIFEGRKKLSGLAHTRKAARFASEEEFAEFVDCSIDKLRKIEYNTK